SAVLAGVVVVDVVAMVSEIETGAGRVHREAAAEEEDLRIVVRWAKRQEDAHSLFAERKVRMDLPAGARRLGEAGGRRARGRELEGPGRVRVDRNDVCRGRVR